jgi:aminoglycoside 2'-N-acetyltransferase I
MSGPVVVRTLATEELTAEQRSSVIDVCVAAHENEEFKKMFTVYIPSGGRHFLAYLGAEVVSHAVVTTRWAQPEGLRELKTAYVDAVATMPQFQSRGCASAVMRRLAAGIGDYEVACLETERPAFYERLGWEVWRGPLAGRSEHGLIPTPEQRGVMVLRLAGTPPIHLEMAMTIECQPERIW